MNYIEELERIATALKEEAAQSDRERESFEFAARMVNAAKTTLKSIEFRQAAQRHFLWVMKMKFKVTDEEKSLIRWYGGYSISIRKYRRLPMHKRHKIWLELLGADYLFTMREAMYGYQPAN